MSRLERAKALGEACEQGDEAAARAALLAMGGGRAGLLGRWRSEREERALSDAFASACLAGSSGCARLLMAAMGERSALPNLEMAAGAGLYEIVVELMGACDPMGNQSSALRLAAAAKRDSGKMVRALLPVSDPLALDSQALKLAAWHGNVEAIQLLIPVSGAKMRRIGALEAAFEGCREGGARSVDAVRALMPLAYEGAARALVKEEAAKMALFSSRYYSYHKQAVALAKEYLSAMDEREALSQAIGVGEARPKSALARGSWL